MPLKPGASLPPGPKTRREGLLFGADSETLAEAHLGAADAEAVGVGVSGAVGAAPA